MCDDQQYAGWSNWPTRMMHNYLMHDQERHNWFMGVLQISDSPQSAALHLKEVFFRGSPLQGQIGSIYNELIQGALGEIDWTELVETSWSDAKGHGKN